MAARPGNSATTEPVAAPKDRRIPLSSVLFRAAIEVPGLQVRVQRLAAGEPVKLSDDQMCPALFLDPELRVLCVGEFLIPFDGAIVEHVVRALAAISATRK